MEKMFSNYNKYFVNYTYFKNFEYFYDYISHMNINKFNNCDNLYDLTNILIDIFNLKNDKKYVQNIKEINMEDIGINLLNKYTINTTVIEKINDENFFNYSSVDKKVYLVNIENGNSIKTNFKEGKIEFKREIYSISKSLDQKKIFACLANIRVVKIFNLDLNQKIMEESIEEINDEDESNIHFNKCIEITTGCLATSDNDMINIWIKNDDFTNSYTSISTLMVNTATYDLLLLNNESFISSQPNERTITFIEIKSLSTGSSLTNIDCIKSINSLFLFRNYILVNCIKGIALISIKEKEFVMYNENDLYNVPDKLICTDGINNVFILDKILENGKLYQILQLNFDEGNFEIKKNYFNIIVGNEDEEEKIKQIIYMDNIVLCGKKIYVLELIDDMD